MTGCRHALRLFAALSCTVLMLGLTTVIAQENSVPEEPTLTVRITPPKPYLQEEIVQVIRVIARYPFEELVLDLPSVDDAEIITLQQPKNRKFSTYGGEGYIYETSRVIFPKRSGELKIPTVRVSGSVDISRKEKKPFALRNEATVLDVRPPPSTFSEDWWLIARDIKIDQGWSEPLDDIRVGDRVTRSITVTAAGVTGAHLPELEHGRSEGLTILPGQIERKTEITKAGVIGTISRSFDIRVDVDQPINISPVRVVWWNTSTEIERQSATPAVRLEPLPRDVDKLVSGSDDRGSGRARKKQERHYPHHARRDNPPGRSCLLADAPSAKRTTGRSRAAAGIDAGRQPDSCRPGPYGLGEEGFPRNPLTVP